MVKFTLPYREIQGVGPAQKPNQLTLKIPQMTEIYITDTVQKKETVLAFLHEFRKTVSRKGEENTIDLIQQKAYTEEVWSLLLGFLCANYWMLLDYFHYYGI